MTEALPEGREKNKENMEGRVRIGTGTRFRKGRGALQPVANHDMYPGLTGSRTLHDARHYTPIQVDGMAGRELQPHLYSHHSIAQALPATTPI